MYRQRDNRIFQDNHDVRTSSKMGSTPSLATLDGIEAVAEAAIAIAMRGKGGMVRGEKKKQQTRLEGCQAD
jgi:hypothetical protein